MAADNNNEGPPIEPIHQKTILKNETPEFVSTTANNGKGCKFEHKELNSNVCEVLMFLEKYGWFVLLGIMVAVFIWSKLEPYWRKWKEKRDRKIEEANIDPARLARSQENMELSRRRMQEAVNARAAEHAEKIKELEAQKRQEKIENWENVQKGRGRSRRLFNTDYNPLGGSGSGSSYRPSRGGNTGGG